MWWVLDEGVCFVVLFIRLSFSRLALMGFPTAVRWSILLLFVLFASSRCVSHFYLCCDMVLDCIFFFCFLCRSRLSLTSRSLRWSLICVVFCLASCFSRLPLTVFWNYYMFLFSLLCLFVLLVLELSLTVCVVFYLFCHLLLVVNPLIV